MKLRKPRPQRAPTPKELQPTATASNRGSSGYPPPPEMGPKVPILQSWTSGSSTASTSRTLQYAQQMEPVAVQRQYQRASEPTSAWNMRVGFSSSEGQSPQGTHIVSASRSEVYWAGRALVAEMQVSERERAQIQLEHAQRHHEERVTRLERVLIALMTLLALVILVLLFRNNGAMSEKRGSPAFRPHLTIPLLSPFTTIVEHEMSHISFRTTALLIIIGAAVVYRLACRWLDKTRG